MSRSTVHELVLEPHDARFPAGLRALADPVARLRVRGAMPDLRGAIAIVGTRAADDDALAFAARLGSALAGAGLAVVSGGARGIDAAAHRGALRVGGATVVVLPTGFAPAFPKQHATLFAEVEASGLGALVTEQPDDLAPYAGTFIARNRIIAALASAVVVVQAPLRSGALSTAAAARALKKPVFSVPHAPWDERGAGFVELLRLGARICTSPRDVLSVPAPSPGPEADSACSQGGKSSDLVGLDDVSRAVWAALAARPRDLESLVTELGLPLPDLLAALLELELRGRVTARRDGTYGRVKGPPIDR